MKQTGPKKNAVIYMRVSTTKQAEKGFSLEDQDKQLPEFCEMLGLDVLAKFSDSESGRNMDRPGFNELLAFCRKHRPGFVVVSALSRFARNIEGQEAARSQLKSYGTSVLSMTERHMDDSATGQLATRMVGVWNHYFSDQLSERMRQSARSSFAAGRWSRSAPLGYLNVNAVAGAPNIVPDESRASLIRRAFELMSTGNHKAADVHRIMVAEGLTTKRGKTIPLQTFVQLLRNPVYVGNQKSHKYSETKQGLWEAIVDHHTYRIVQMLLDGRKPSKVPHSRNHPQFPLRGTLVCSGCSKPLTAGNAKGRTGKKYPYYFCRTTGCRAVKNTPAGKIETQFLTLLGELRACPEFAERVLPELKTAWQSTETERTATLAQLRAELAEQRDLRDKLVHAFLKENIDQQTYNRMKQSFDEACDGHEEWIASLEGREAISVIFWAFSKNIFTDVGAAWRRADVNKQQMFQKTLFPSGLKYSAVDGILNPDNCSMFSELKSVVSAFTTFGVPDGI